VANVGNWLDVDTTSTDGAGFGMKLTAAAGAIGLEAPDIVLTATVASLSFNAPDFLFMGDFSGTDDFAVNIGGNMILNAKSGAAQIAMQPGVGIQLFTTIGPVIVPQGDFRVPGLPTSDPAVTGQFWNNAGVVRVSL
jgi:hypothetical protein